jgi:hypothetical protein
MIKRCYFCQIALPGTIGGTFFAIFKLVQQISQILQALQIPFLRPCLSLGEQELGEILFAILHVDDMLVLVSVSSLRYLAKILHLQSSSSRRIERFPLFEFDQDGGLVLVPVLRYLDSIAVPLSTRVTQLSNSN